MRQIALDTETTGLNIHNGNRIVEIGCVELINRQFTGNNLHFYINPERDSEESALAVHGLTTEFLNNKPKFAEIVNTFCEYIYNTEIIIHNAAFDINFLNTEFKLLNLSPFTEHVASIIDSLQMAKELYPGRRNSLDALCDRYSISRASRTLHGGLIDATLLAEVYLTMTRGQNNLPIDLVNNNIAYNNFEETNLMSCVNVVIIPANADELHLHETTLNNIDQQLKTRTCIWHTFNNK